MTNHTDNNIQTKPTEARIPNRVWLFLFPRKGVGVGERVGLRVGNFVEVKEGVKVG
jgi:hypothetical protein